MTDSADWIENLRQLEKSHLDAEMIFDNEHCFLCGCELTSDNRSSEDIFPKWLQKRHDLPNLPNLIRRDTPLKYRKIIVPACKTCNNEHLGNLEKIMSRAFSEGYKGLIKLDRSLIFLWALKIFVGKHCLERRLRSDIRNPDSPKISLPEQDQDILALHTMLQGVRKPMGFPTSNPPFSVMIVNLHEAKNEEFAIGYYSHSLTQTVIVRSKSAGIIVNLQDGGRNQANLGNTLDKANELKLHINQFNELALRASLSAWLHYPPAYHLGDQEDLLSNPPFFWMSLARCPLFKRIKADVLKTEMARAFEEDFGHPPGSGWRFETGGSYLFRGREMMFLDKLGEEIRAIPLQPGPPYPTSIKEIEAQDITDFSWYRTFEDEKPTNLIRLPRHKSI